jgi:hypothetical protein
LSLNLLTHFSFPLTQNSMVIPKLIALAKSNIQ